MIAKIKSLSDLRMRAACEPAYQKLALIGARNLGGSAETLESALQWLEINAMESNERGVVAEVNFCRSLVKVD